MTSCYTCAVLFTRLICQHVAVSQAQILARKSYLYDKCRAMCFVSLVSLRACLLPVDWLLNVADGTVVVPVSTVLSCGQLLRWAALRWSELLSSADLNLSEVN